MSWPFDDSQPLVTPDQHAEYMRRRAGLDQGQWALPPVLVATFQRAAWERLAAGIGQPAASPAAPGVPVVGGASGTPVAALWLQVGAPAAVLQLELAIARGVRKVVVVGSAGSLRRNLPTGSAIVITGAEREDGTSHHYLPAGDVVTADPELSLDPPIHDGALAPRHTISRPDFCGPHLRILRMRALRSSAPAHDLAHLDPNSLAANR